MQVSRQILNLQVRDEVILVDEVPNALRQTGRDCLRPGFRAEFNFPLHAILIAHEEFWAGPVHIFLGEGERSARFVVFPAGAIEQVPI